ncbi:hypothetical protein VNI00_007465 [Paramarasmius palmivorus]|uniref:F-box domain-containing protein n=1 Tax=Paramarasmius palmivorus TaxID=297713 RepID=A0AAW0D2P8_9AGAR
MSKSPILPIEVVILILSHLRGSKQDINTCALVCRAWLPTCRPMLFDGCINFYTSTPVRLKRFIRLCNSSFETFSVANAYELSIIQKRSKLTARRILRTLLEWRSSDKSRTLSTVLPRLRRVQLMSWDTPYTPWNAGFHHIFDASPVERLEGVHQLYLEGLHFNTKELRALMVHFPQLQSLQIGEYCSGTSVATRKSNLTPLCSGRLTEISVVHEYNVSLIGLLVPCATLNVFRLHVPFVCYAEPETEEGVTTVNGLLHSAGTSMEEFEFSFTSHTDPDPVSGNLTHVFDVTPLELYLRRLDLTSNTHIRKISLDFSAHPDYLLFFLDRLSNGLTSQVPFLEALKLPHLDPSKTDWKGLDTILQRHFFSSVNIIRCSFICRFGELDVSKQPKSRAYDAPDQDSVAEANLQTEIFRLQTLLPRCHERRLLHPEVTYSFCVGSSQTPSPDSEPLITPEQGSPISRVTNALRHHEAASRTLLLDDTHEPCSNTQQLLLSSSYLLPSAILTIMAAPHQTCVVVEAFKGDLENLNRVCDSLSGQSLRVVELGPTSTDTINALKELQHEAKRNQKTQETMLQKTKDWVRQDAQEHILTEIKKQIQPEIKAEVASSVRSQVEAQILDHVPISLKKQLEDCESQLKEVKISFENSEARQRNSTLDLTKQSDLDDPLGVVLKPDGSRSKWYPADLTSLFAYDSDATEALLKDYELSVDKTLEGSFNRFMSHIGPFVSPSSSLVYADS